MILLFKWFTNLFSKKSDSQLIEDKKEEVKNIIKNGITLTITGPQYSSSDIPEYTRPSWCEETSPVQIGFQAGLLDYDPITNEREPFLAANERIISELMPEEITFFKTLLSETINSGFKGAYEIWQNADDSFKICFNSNSFDFPKFIGQVKLRLYEPEYACMRINAKRPYRVFKTKEEALDFIKSHKDYNIIERRGETHQYLSYKTRVNSDSVILKGLSFDEYYAATKHFINYLRYLLTLAANKKNYHQNK